MPRPLPLADRNEGVHRANAERKVLGHGGTLERVRRLIVDIYPRDVRTGQRTGIIQRASQTVQDATEQTVTDRDL